MRVVPIRKGITFEIDCGRFRLAFKTHVTLSAGFDFSVLCALMYAYTKGQDMAVRRMSDAFISFIQQLGNLEESEALADFAKPIKITRSELLTTARLTVSTENLKRLNEAIDHFHSIQLLVIDTRETQVRWSSARLVQTAQASYGDGAGKKDDVLQITFNPVLAASCLIDPAELEEDRDIKRMFLYTKIPLELLRQLDPRNAERYLFAYLRGRVTSNVRQALNHKNLIDMLWPVDGSKAGNGSKQQYDRIGLIKKALDRVCEVGDWDVTHQAGYSYVYPKHPYTGKTKESGLSLSEGFSDFWKLFKPMLRPEWADRINYMRNRARAHWVKEELADRRDLIQERLREYLRECRRPGRLIMTPLKFLQGELWWDYKWPHEVGPVWWDAAGFRNRIEAEICGCTPSNVSSFRCGINILSDDGKAVPGTELIERLKERVSQLLSSDSDESTLEHVAQTVSKAPRTDLSGAINTGASPDAAAWLKTRLAQLAPSSATGRNLGLTSLLH